MKLRSLAREWRIVRAPRPKPWDRRGIAAIQKQEHRTAVVEANPDEIKKLYRRLERAAEKFWPKQDRDYRAERVSSTIVEALERLQKGESHTISWWAKFMWGRSISAFHRNKEDLKDATADDLWAGVTPPVQENYVMGRQTVRLCELLPSPHREVMLMRAGGENPIEIADELSLTVDRVIDVLTEGRHWLSDGGCYLSLNN
jgi:DNA-directed RNA polymerase specialized sigma24 family protein